MNGDGYPDLATVHYNTSSVRLYLGSGDGSFRFSGVLKTDTGPRSLILHDINGDGRFDVLTANDSRPASVSVFLGNGDGSFQAGAKFYSSLGACFLGVQDLNGDNRSDLIVANLRNNSNSSISVLFNDSL